MTAYNVFVVEVFEKIRQAQGFLDIVCNNAGIYAEDNAHDKASLCIDINLVGVFTFYRCFFQFSSNALTYDVALCLFYFALTTLSEYDFVIFYSNVIVLSLAIDIIF